MIIPNVAMVNHLRIEKMNNKVLGLIAAAIVMVAVMVSARPGDDAITKENGVTIVNTQQIAKGIKGYRGNTPVKIYIKKNKVQKVEALGNQETPKFFAKAKTLLNKYQGMTVKKAARMNVDAVTGATFSSRALVKNVQAGLEYYQKQK